MDCLVGRLRLVHRHRARGEKRGDDRSRNTPVQTVLGAHVPAPPVIRNEFTLTFLF
jgi:hypothetical protein